MNKQKWIIFVAAIVLIAAAAGVLNQLRTNQRLGSPGIKATPVPGSILMNFDLPERVLDFTSTNVPTAQVVLGWLPKDTSYAQRYYLAADGFWVTGNVILMGTDRSSIHQADICLPGQGWHIDKKTIVNIPIADTPSHELKVAKWILSNSFLDREGVRRPKVGLYVFWFVADNEQTADLRQVYWLLARDLLRTGVLQRWAYVSYFTACDPGFEDAAFARVRKLIAASVPEFQLPPRIAGTSMVARSSQE